jgi:Zn-dependent peptidase ImmA (M78 family)
MLAEISTEELTRTLDEVAAGALSQAGIAEPPVDALRLAQRLGLAVAWDDRQTGRARLVQFAGEQSREMAAVLVRHDPRHERLQWAIAHEVGELLAEKVFAELILDPREAPAQAREFIANALASRLLLPKSTVFARCNRLRLGFAGTQTSLPNRQP